MSNSLDDIASSAQAFFVIGSNLTEQHPVFGARIRQSILKRHIRMVVASPDVVNIEEYGTLALRHKPGTEGLLVNGLIHILLEKGLQDESAIQKFPSGFNEAKAIIAQYTPERVSKLTEVPSDKLYAAADILASHHPMTVLSGSGISNSEAMHALANLQLLLGNLGVAGGGISPLRAQNNAQGSRDMGCLPGYLPGYQHVGGYTALGDMTIKGQTRPFTAPFSLLRQPGGGFLAQGRFPLKRSDFGIGGGDWDEVVANEADTRFKIVLLP